MEGHVAVLVAQHDGRADPGGVGADEDPGGVHQPGAEAEAARAVVVAAADDHGGPRPGEAGEGLVGQLDGVDVGQGAVVDVPGDHDDVDALRLDHLEQVVDERTLVAQEALAVEGPPEVPVGGVEDAHGTKIGGGTDSPAPPRRGGRRGVVLATQQ